jgi:hypothetical protein
MLGWHRLGVAFDVLAMKTLSLYDQIIPLNRQTHQSLRIKASEHPWSFARQTHSLMLASSELPLAALDYPCVFAPSGEHHVMVSLVGLRSEHNLFVDEQGHWEPHCYVPAFVRRYPFVLAEQGEQTPLSVCIDSAFDGLNQQEGEALFDADGKDTPYFQQLQKFLGDFHGDMLRTGAFTKRLFDLGLLVERQIDFKLGAQHFNLNGLKVVDENRLRQLDDATTLALCKSGAMGCIHAHLLSLNNVNKLAARLSRQLQH